MKASLHLQSNLSDFVQKKAVSTSMKSSTAYHLQRKYISRKLLECSALSKGKNLLTFFKNLSLKTTSEA